MGGGPETRASALSGAALGQVAARERKIGFARGAEVAGAVAEDEYGLAGAAQGAQGRPLAGSRPAARAIAEHTAEGEAVGRPALGAAAHELAGVQLDGRQLVPAPDGGDRLAQAGAHDDGAPTARVELGEKRRQAGRRRFSPSSTRAVGAPSS